LNFSPAPALCSAAGLFSVSVTTSHPFPPLSAPNSSPTSRGAAGTPGPDCRPPEVPRRRRPPPSKPTPPLSPVSCHSSEFHSPSPCPTVCPRLPIAHAATPDKHGPPVHWQKPHHSAGRGRGDHPRAPWHGPWAGISLRGLGPQAGLVLFISLFFFQKFFFDLKLLNICANL
jgi:hypothetical protein